MIAERSRKRAALTPEQSEMVGDSFLLARIGQVADKWARGKWWIDRDDLFSTLCEAATVAVRNFDPTKGVKFRTYAMNRVHFAVKDYLRQNGKMGFSGAEHEVRQGGMSFDVISVNAAVKDSKEVDRVGDLLVAARCPLMAEMLSYDLIDYALVALSQRERSIIDMYVFGGYTMKEIGRAHGLSESRVSQLYGELTERLRPTLRRRLDATA